MKITCINVRVDVYPQMGLCYLSSYLKQHLPGVQICLIELVFGENREKAVRKILATKPDLIGITTYSVGFQEVIELSNLLKRSSPSTLVTLGGPHITTLPQTMPETSDLAVIGEGEQTLLEVCRLWGQSTSGAASPEAALRSFLDSPGLAGINGIAYRSGGELVCTEPRALIDDLDSIPPPDLSILNMRWYTSLKQFLVKKGLYHGFTLLTSRGCPYSCRFCQASALWKKVRYHSAQRVVWEIERLCNEYPNVNALNIIDDLSIANKPRLKEIVRLMQEKNLHKRYDIGINGHVNVISDELLEILKQINVTQLVFGFESASERILEFLKKGSSTVEKNRRAAEMCRAHGIGVGGLFMVGCIGETEEDMKKTIQFVRETPMTCVNMCVTTPLPGTELWELCKEKGLVSDSMDWNKLDFGNVNNPDLLYINESGIPYLRFKELLQEGQDACKIWNPPQSIIGNLCYLYVLPLDEFFRRAIKKLKFMPRHLFLKLVNRLNIQNG
jgi:radical SAM superfamily enzyme YgiQ (UPF0313 family)